MGRVKTGRVKVLAVLFAIAFLAGIGPAMAADLKLEAYFAGRTSAVGQFSAINGVKRGFDVDLRGRWDGKTLTLVEDFTYSDGERDRKTWRFRKIGPGRYLGTREDVVGETLVTVVGDTARFSYLVYLDAAARKNQVRFHDSMVLQADGSLVNKAVVTKFGFPVATTRVDFHRNR